MADNQYSQPQQPVQTQASAQENVPSAITLTTDRTLQASSAADLQHIEEVVLRNDHNFGFGF
jgi:hypothetical protein